MFKKLETFIQALHTQSSSFMNNDFTMIDFSDLKSTDFVYADPPYLVTCASYNEQGGWNEQKEVALLFLLDELSSRGVRFALSNVMESKGKTNEILLNWINHRPEYRLFELNYTYNNANYQRKNKGMKTREVLILN